jgi:hypothetical protein
MIHFYSKGTMMKKSIEILDIQVVDSEIIATEVKQETKKLTQ